MTTPESPLPYAADPRDEVGGRPPLFSPAVERYALQPSAWIPGHRLQPLYDGKQAYAAMLGAIATANQTVFLETYIFKPDAAGKMFVEALCERARAGVTVRLIVDAVGSFSLSDALRRDLVRNGVELAEFHPVAPWRRRWGWSVRDHRKLLVVDGRVGFAGGLNISAENLPREEGGKAWHDVHLEIHGPAVREMQRHFLASWRYAATVLSEQSHPRLGRATPPTIGRTPVAILAVSKRQQRSLIRRHYAHAMRRARRRILVQAAYFVPERGLRRIFRNAIARGVTVDIMVPHVSDVRAAQYAGEATYASLLRAGVNLYTYLPSMMHAKTLVVDGAWGAIGSFNFDHRSLVYNWELSIAFADEQVAQGLEQKFEEDVTHCQKLDLETWQKRSFAQRVFEQVFYRFRRWL